jgi:WD40 repeat protein
MNIGKLLARAALVIPSILILSSGSADGEEEPAEAAAESVSYYHDIRPIFQAHCHGCHQPAKQSGEYVMTSFDALVQGGESGLAAVVPGEPGESYLIEQITSQGGKAEMPQGQPPLAPSDVEKVATWIIQGALNDTPQSARPQYDSEHPPSYNALPVITSLDFSPDGALLAVSGYHEVLLHRADGSGLAGRLVGESERIESAVFSPDGRWLAVAGGSPGRMGEVQIWDVVARKLQLSQNVGYDTCYGASWSPDGKLVAIGCADNTVRALDAETGRQVLFNGAHSDWVLDTVFSAKSDHLVTVSRDMSMKLIEVGTQRFIDNLTSITPGALKGGLNAVDRHPAKDELLVGGADGVPQIFKMIRTDARKIGDNANLIRAFPAMPGRVFDVAFSPDGNRIVAGSSNDGAGQVRVYNVADGKELTKIDVSEGGVFAVTFSADGKTIATGGFDGQVRLHDAATGILIKQFAPVDIEPPSVAAKD